jgi:hypothetical protein
MFGNSEDHDDEELGCSFCASKPECGNAHMDARALWYPRQQNR